MKRLLAVILCVTMMAGFGIALGEDVSVLPGEAEVEEFGIPTGEELADLKAEAEAFWQDQNYSSAADAYTDLAFKAGWMADILSRVNAPLTAADPEAQAAFSSGALFEQVTAAGQLEEEYTALRKLALIRTGMSYYYQEDFDNALPFLMEALRLIDISEAEDWTMCTEAVLAIVSPNAPVEEE